MNRLHLETVLNLDFAADLQTGASEDILSRLKALLPAGWFPEASTFTGESQTPILDAVLTGPASAFSFVYYLIRHAKDQTRLRSMSGGFLDLASYDFFGYFLPRRAGETDGSFLVRIIHEIFRQRVTRAGIIEAVTDITGRAPLLHEPWNPSDNGVYDAPQDQAVLAYDAGIGAWGGDPWTVYDYPASAGAGYGIQPCIGQIFVTVFRPTDGRDYNDLMVFDIVNRVRACGVIVWLQFSNDGTVIVDDAGEEIVTDFDEPFLIEGEAA